MDDGLSILSSYLSRDEVKKLSKRSKEKLENHLNSSKESVAALNGEILKIKSDYGKHYKIYFSI